MDVCDMYVSISGTLEVFRIKSIHNKSIPTIIIIIQNPEVIWIDIG